MTGVIPWCVSRASRALVKTLGFTEHHLSESWGGRVLQEGGDQVSRRVCSEWLERKFAGFPGLLEVSGQSYGYDLNLDLHVFGRDKSNSDCVGFLNHATTMSWDHEEEVELIAIKKRTRR